MTLAGGAISIYQYKGGQLGYVETPRRRQVGEAVKEAAQATGDAAKAVADAAKDAVRRGRQGRCDDGRRCGEERRRRNKGCGREEVTGVTGYNLPRNQETAPFGAVSIYPRRIGSNGYPASAKSSMARSGRHLRHGRAGYTMVHGIMGLITFASWRSGDDRYAGCHYRCHNA